MAASFFTLTPKTHSSALSTKPHRPYQFGSFTQHQFLKFPHISRFGNSHFSITRAGGSNVDVIGASAIRPGGSVESDKLPSDVRKRAMNAIDSCSRRVTIGDVASKAGLTLNEAQNALQALAADTNGFLEVSDEGDVLYVFPKNYWSKLAAKSLRIKLEPLLDKGKMVAAYLGRMSPGTTLIASTALVYITIISIISSNRYKS